MRNAISVHVFDTAQNARANSASLLLSEAGAAQSSSKLLALKPLHNDCWQIYANAVDGYCLYIMNGDDIGVWSGSSNRAGVVDCVSDPRPVGLNDFDGHSTVKRGLPCPVDATIKATVD